MHLDQRLFLLTKHVLFIFVLSIVLKFSQIQAKTRQPWRKRVLKSFAEWWSIQSPRQEVFIRLCLSFMSTNELSVEHCWPIRSELTKWEATDQCSNATCQQTLLLKWAADREDGATPRDYESEDARVCRWREITFMSVLRYLDILQSVPLLRLFWLN